VGGKGGNLSKKKKKGRLKKQGSGGKGKLQSLSTTKEGRLSLLAKKKGPAASIRLKNWV